MSDFALSEHPAPLNRSYTYTYDSLGRLTSVKAHGNHTSSVQLDGLGNITRLRGPLNAQTNYTYDDRGNLLSESTPSGGTVYYSHYTPLEQYSVIRNGRNQTKTFYRTNDGRLSEYENDSNGELVTYTYDSNGNCTEKDSTATGTVTREYDALNRVTKYTDIYGNVIEYGYNAAGNLMAIAYPDNTVVYYDYDGNNNLVTVTDWAERVTHYTYDELNRVIGVEKPDGSTTTVTYNDKGQMVSSVEKTADNVVISGFEYTYDTFSRIVKEKNLATCLTMWYTYDSKGRVSSRQEKDASGALLSQEAYTYDAAGNMVDAPGSCFDYSTNNCLTSFCNQSVTYDLDGNMLDVGTNHFTYDDGNRLLTANGHTYTYDVENTRVRNQRAGYDTTYVYDTNAVLSRLLMKTTNGKVTKYVYGLGLIGEEKQGGCFKTYHFDYRGSTVAITDESGNLTDIMEYDTYGKMTEHIGNSYVIFGYNGRDGVVTDNNGLYYMRARYYNPDMRRFLNADIVRGDITESITLNRYAYANGNPVSFVDPFGLTTTAASNWFVDAGIWLNKHARNKDGSYAFYDNQRFDEDKEFHEQFLAFTPSAPSFGFDEEKNLSFGLGRLSLDFTTAGWEGENYDFSLLDFGHVEVGAEFKNGNLYVGALASAWSPSISFSIFGVDIELGFEIMAIGGEFNVGKGGFSLKAALGWGFSLSIS